MSLLLSIDPSSTRTGYAVLNDRQKLVDGGLLRPRRTADPANERVDAMIESLIEIGREHQISAVVVEDTSGKVAAHGRARGMNGAGLAVHGKAVGEFRRACIMIFGADCVTCVMENEWTQQVSKAHRAQRVAAVYRSQGYDPAKDKGGDTADAIGLGVWWLVVGQYQHAARAHPWKRIEAAEALPVKGVSR